MGLMCFECYFVFWRWLISNCFSLFTWKFIQSWVSLRLCLIHSLTCVDSAEFPCAMCYVMYTSWTNWLNIIHLFAKLTAIQCPDLSVCKHWNIWEQYDIWSSVFMLRMIAGCRGVYLNGHQAVTADYLFYECKYALFRALHEGCFVKL